MRAFALLGLMAALSTALTAQPVELKVGDPAPDFTLQGSDGRTYTLADYRGKQAVLLAWFPKAFTSGCTIECKSLTEKGHLIRKYDVVYFMASVDPLTENKGFAEKEKANFPLLSDPKKAAATAYGVLNDRGMASRWTFYIDQSGRIAAIDKAVKPATSAEDMAARLGEIGVATRQATQ